MAHNGNRLRHDSAAAVRCEQRALVCFTLGSTIAVILWIIAMSTDYWFTVSSPDSGGLYVNKTRIIFLYSHSGLWRICRTQIINKTSENDPVSKTECHYHNLFPSNKEIDKNPELDRTIMDYTRTETAFSVISLCLMLMGVGFSVYTFTEPRYMFKRLAGGVHFITAATVLVVIEVLTNSVRYEEHFLRVRHPKGSIWRYGYSFGLAWVVFSVYLSSGCAFIIFSRKRKGDKAADEYHAREDEPNILGRV
ncbi:transmembrane protein 114-like, partial [Limulus polyphemus]|uniref:Transmembrane protein 114-like n=1 Tax=Limulus polyphemus TaxID=6850 RepID=A0ABM1BRX9_LIMPO